MVSAAGLVPALRLAESAGLYDLLGGLSVPAPNAVAKTAGLVGGMLAGADSIDDMDLLRHGGMGRLFSGVRAPSTLGTFLRSFTHGNVQQLDAVNAGLLAGLARRVPGLLAGGGTDGIAFIDVDDTIREVHGYAKLGAGFGYTKQRGLNIQLATVSTPVTAPVIARARLRSGNTASAKGAGRMLAQALTTARAAGTSGRVLARADSAYYGWAFVGTAIRAGAWSSVTARMTKTVTAAITSIPTEDWTPISYPNSIFDEAEQRWVSDAEVAEVPFVAFTGRRKHEHVACRLVVRRVKRGGGGADGQPRPKAPSPLTWHPRSELPAVHSHAARCAVLLILIYLPAGRSRVLSMEVEANKTLVRRFYEQVWAAGNVAFAGEVFGEDHVRHDLRPTQAAPGPAGQALIAEQFRSAFPDLEWHVDLVLGEGDLVAARWTATGTLSGPWGSVAPTGRRATFSGVNIFRFDREGKVAEIWNHRDDLGLLQQLGVPVIAGAPSPAAESSEGATGAS